MPIPILGKESINFKDYLPAGVKLAFHRVGWHGVPGHTSMPGYNSADPKTCDKEIAAAIEMGGDVIDHLDHGPNSPFHRSVREMLAATERAGLGFTINQGSKVCPDAAKNDPIAATQAYVDAIIFAARSYFDSPNYQLIGGRPVVKFFGPPAVVDFSKVRAAVASANPLFIFNFTEGFRHAESDGALGWPHPKANPDDFSLSDLLAFRDAAAANPGKTAFYSVFKAFYDPNPKDPTKQAWDITLPVRRMNPQDGLVALLTAKLVPQGATQVEVATLEDVQEGTAMLLSQGTL